jgi:hypothetical protein
MDPATEGRSLEKLAALLERGEGTSPASERVCRCMALTLTKELLRSWHAGTEVLRAYDGWHCDDDDDRRVQYERYVLILLLLGHWRMASCVGEKPAAVSRRWEVGGRVRRDGDGGERRWIGGQHSGLQDGVCNALRGLILDGDPLYSPTVLLVPVLSNNNAEIIIQRGILERRLHVGDGCLWKER